MKQVAHRQEGRLPQQTLATPQIDGQLGRLAQGRGQLRRVGSAAACGDQTRALQRDQPAALDLQDGLDQLLDPLARVDRDRDDGEILRKRQQPIGAQVVKASEALAASQQHAHSKAPLAVEVQQLVGEQLAADAIALAEVGRQLQAVLVHRATPIACPSAAAPKPMTRLTATFAPAVDTSESSARRWDSSIHVENVV